MADAAEYHRSVLHQSFRLSNEPFMSRSNASGALARERSWLRGIGATVVVPS
jgi:hypothetical protein